MTPLIITRENFNNKVGCVYNSFRYGYKHGFEAIGLQPRFVKHSEIATTEVADPLYWLTWDDFNYLSDEAFSIIKRSLHIVLVNPWFHGVEQLETLYNVPHPVISRHTIERILLSNPTYVWGLDPEELMWAYETWRDVGMRTVSLPWACDTAHYYPSDESGFEDVQVGFVGSYRGYKTPQYEDYLWPYEDRLKIWAHAAWPKCYQGTIDSSRIRVLYKNARVCPTISEPYFDDLWIVPERPFAVLGSGGLTVLDVNPSYRYFFDERSVLMPGSLAEYHDMVEIVLSNEPLNQVYRTMGYEEVLNKHTFAHRARKLISELERN